MQYVCVFVSELSEKKKHKGAEDQSKDRNVSQAFVSQDTDYFINLSGKLQHNSNMRTHKEVKAEIAKVLN